MNNGPWGQALTTEFIPYIESKYRMDARHQQPLPQRPLLRRMGHAVAADSLSQSLRRHLVDIARPSDFHDFTGVDLYAAHANVYHRPTVRLSDHARQGQGVATFESSRSWSSHRSLRRPDRVVRVGVLAARPGGAAGTDVQSRDRGRRSGGGAYWQDHYDIAYWSSRTGRRSGRISMARFI